MQEDKLRRLSVHIESSTKSIVRNAVLCSRVCEEKQNLIHGENAPPVGVIVVLINGDGTTTVGGEGQILDTFQETGKISGYPGEGTQMATIFDDNYQTAHLKLLRYDQTFKKHKKDVSQSK